MINIRTIDRLPLKSGSRVFYRVDYNVPMEGTRITDATRIEETLPTLKVLRDRGAALVIASHLGRPKGKHDEKYSLKPVRDRLSQLLNVSVQWVDDCIGVDAEEKSAGLKAGELLLVENLRFHPGEEKNDREFAEQLRKLGDFYVNDAFGASHRAHASIDALPRLFPKKNIAGGLLLAKEIEFLQKVTNVSDRPFIALLGGAKIAGKIEPLEALMKHADAILIGGGMANTFLAAQNLNMGDSLIDHESMEVARRILAEGSRAQMIVPVDVVVADSLESPTKIETVDVSAGLSEPQRALDIGPKTIARFTAELK
ncbi:MAG TPA: phosphoglycerate kinase, partial [Thermoanaerobaculia bacterium]|nr:phosphoglycerate kinase [Thermoanaerobaculia bacterium]